MIPCLTHRVSVHAPLNPSIAIREARPSDVKRIFRLICGNVSRDRVSEMVTQEEIVEALFGKDAVAECLLAWGPRSPAERQENSHCEFMQRTVGMVMFCPAFSVQYGLRLRIEHLFVLKGVNCLVVKNYIMLYNV